MNWITVQVYTGQLLRSIRRIPIIGLCFSNSIKGNAVSVGLAILSVFLGSLGVWLPASVITLQSTVPFIPHAMIEQINRTSSVDGSMLILVPSLIAPCAVLLFGPWNKTERIVHQVFLLGVTALLYMLAFIIVITQLSGGVADKLLLLRASWWMLAVAIAILYFYELLSRMKADILGSTRAEGDDLMRRTLRNMDSDDRGTH